VKHINKNCNHCDVKLVLGINYSDYRYDQRDYSCKACYSKIVKTSNKEYNNLKMYVNGKYVSRKHPLYKAGNFKTFEGAAFSSLKGYAKTTEGYVYIINNPCWNGWIKVGMAIDAEDRCKSYQTSSPLRDYKLCYSKFFDDRKKAEQSAHSLLKKEAEDNKGEWFKIKQDKAIEIISTL
tara:strand:+ start:3361 stop:3897 length:537 start_codon:yes stop_codon:yes gene_type:complete